MRTEKLKVRVGKSVVTIIDNGKTRIRTIRPFGVEDTEKSIKVTE
jgi:hypothetical protein